MPQHSVFHAITDAARDQHASITICVDGSGSISLYTTSRGRERGHVSVSWEEWLRIGEMINRVKELRGEIAESE